MLLEVMGILGDSILKDDLLIFITATIELIIGVAVVFLAISINNQSKTNRDKKKVTYSLRNHKTLRLLNTVFLTGITLFPLYGMLGTVFGLLGLDLATGDMDNIRANFFVALTSTAWGIIFSCVFKVLYSLFADFIEDQIKVSEKAEDSTMFSSY